MYRGKTSGVNSRSDTFPIYDPWGNITNTSSDPINNLTFVGRYGGLKDWDTGFIQFQHRWYDAEVGKWISRDPIGVEGGSECV